MGSSTHIPDACKWPHFPTDSTNCQTTPEPPIAARVPSRACRVDELKRDRLHPPVHRHVINSDAALGQHFLHIGVEQAVAQLPAHLDRDHLPRQAVTPGADQAAPELITRSVSRVDERLTNATNPD